MTSRSTLTIIVLVAFALRMGYALTQDHTAPFDRAGGGDAWWYLEFGYRQVIDVELEPLSPAPLYLLVVGSIRYLLQPESTETVMLMAAPGGGLDIASVPGVPSPMTVIVVRVLQSLLSTAVVYFVYRIAHTVSGEARVGLVAAAAMALSLTMLVSAAEIQTETMYLFFLTAALMLYVDLFAGKYRNPLLWFAVCGGLLGLATLTRAVLLLFPLGLTIHAVVVHVLRPHPKSPSQWAKGVGANIAVLLLVYAAVCAIWSGYYYVRWGEVVIGAKGMTAFFYLGTQGGAPPPADIDSALGLDMETADETTPRPDYAAGASDVIASNPLGYITGRLSNLLDAYLQPYGTEAFPGESLKALVLNWLQEDRSLAGLMDVLRGDAFLPKLLIYLTHYIGITLGLVGMWLTRAQWRLTLPLIGFVFYVTLLHLVLLALPRYIFPTLPFWWCFAAVTLVRMGSFGKYAHTKLFGI